MFSKACFLSVHKLICGMPAGLSCCNSARYIASVGIQETETLVATKQWISGHTAGTLNFLTKLKFYMNYLKSLLCLCLDQSNAELTPCISDQSLMHL